MITRQWKFSKQNFLERTFCLAASRSLSRRLAKLAGHLFDGRKAKVNLGEDEYAADEVALVINKKLIDPSKFKLDGNKLTIFASAFEDLPNGSYSVAVVLYSSSPRFTSTIPPDGFSASYVNLYSLSRSYSFSCARYRTRIR